MIEKPGAEGGVAKPYMYMTSEETERIKIRLERKREDKVKNAGASFRFSSAELMWVFSGRAGTHYVQTKPRISQSACAY